MTARRRGAAHLRLDPHLRRASHERWLVSYADFLTLMFALFTTLYAVSLVDPERPTRVPSTVHAAAVPPIAGTAEAVDVTSPALAEAAARTRELAGLRDQLADRLRSEIAADRVVLRLDGRGLVVTLPAAGAFATGSAELSGDARALIDTVAAAIGPLDNIIRVEGHADDVPISTARYRSNWELSTARATNVVNYLVSQHRMPAGRFAVAGYGEFRPQWPNDSADNRAKNRRVDIVVLTTQAASLTEPMAVGEGGDA